MEGIPALMLGYSANYNYNEAKAEDAIRKRLFQLNSGLNAFGRQFRDSSSYNKS